MAARAPIGEHILSNLANKVGKIFCHIVQLREIEEVVNISACEVEVMKHTL